VQYQKGLRKALKLVSEGSTLLFWKLDRLGRDVDAIRVRSIIAMGRIQARLERIIGRPVDVARRGALRAGVAAEAERDEPMPSKRPAERLTDTVRNCDSILEYRAELDLDGYVAASQMVRDAVERCFLRISGAAYKLGDYLDPLYLDGDWEGAGVSAIFFVTNMTRWKIRRSGLGSSKTCRNCARQRRKRLPDWKGRLVRRPVRRYWICDTGGTSTPPTSREPDKMRLKSCNSGRSMYRIWTCT
jgi:hypothetical protein